MKFALLYFTGTYNTLYLTTLLKNILKENQHEIEVFEITRLKKLDYKKYDQIGIGYPIHAFNAPKIVEKSLKKLNILNSNYFIYKNSGEPFKLNNASSFKIYQIMKKRHNTFYGEFHFLMPYNILFKTNKNMIGLFLKYNIIYLKYMVDHLTPTFYKVDLKYRLLTFVFKIQRLGCKINSYFYKIEADKCIHCKKCYQNCPVNNIFFDYKNKKIVFKNHCIMCMRCSFNCPSDAIKIGFLNNWKVNGAYDFLNVLKQFDEKEARFLLNNDKFYKKYQKYFKSIDSLRR